MKKINLLFIVLVVSIALKGQTTCSNFKLDIDMKHHTNTTAHDSAFVRIIQFDLSDTTTVSKIGYTLSNASAGSVIQTQNYTLSSIPATQDLTVTNNCSRTKKTVEISLGYLRYLNIKYAISINLYDKNNNLLGIGSFNFSN